MHHQPTQQQLKERKERKWTVEKHKDTASSAHATEKQIHSC